MMTIDHQPLRKGLFGGPHFDPIRTDKRGRMNNMNVFKEKEKPCNR